MRTTLTYFSKSTASKTRLTEMRYILLIGRGLETIGKTRFATICISAMALERCFPAIVKLVENGTQMVSCTIVLVNMSLLTCALRRTKIFTISSSKTATVVRNS